MRASTTLPHPGCVVLDRPALLSKFIERLRGTEHAFCLPLYQAALAGELDVVLLPPGGRVPKALLNDARPPTVIVVAGDASLPASPPEAFPQARRLLAWSAFAILHATGGEALHYQAAAEAASLTRRVLLIETATARERAWLDLARAENDRRQRAGRHLPLLLITAPKGGVHPTAGVAA